MARFLWVKVGLVVLMSLWAATCFAQIQRDQTQQQTQKDLGIENTPASEELKRVRTLIRANVLDLAERIMEQQGPPMLPGGDWLNWERQLWSLYKTQGKWQELYDRIQSIPPAFPVKIRREAELQSIAALMALGRGGQARKILRQQLLSGRLSERDKIPLRRQVIESYLSESLLHDANLAATSYHSDYRPQDRDWLLLNAQINLRIGNPDEVVNSLAPLDEPDARLLRTYARLLNGSLSPLQVLEVASGFREDPAFEAMQQLLMVVIIEAAKRSGQLFDQVDILEQYLVTPNRAGRALADTLPGYSIDDLRNAYTELALSLADASGFLVGDEDSWVEFAVALAEEDHVARRAVWSTIKEKAADPLKQQLAIDSYVNGLIDHERTPLAHHVFGEQGFMGLLTLSPSTGLRLSNVAVDQGDVVLAAEANANVSGPPPGMSYADWLIYTGRISVIGGYYERGAAQLEKWVALFDQLSPAQTDSILQPVFDLQTVNKHDLAIPLLQMIDLRSPGGKYHREIAFWIAESYSATRQHIKAADYFLFSAMQKDNGLDQWGESARFRAADALMEGKLFADARTLLEDLLKRAKEENRKAGLKQKLQQLWLRESSLRSVN